MSEFKGTPGPWEYKASSSDAHKWISTSEGVLMSSDYPFSQSINASEHDWRLIAAAPDLLEALLMLQKQALQSELNSPTHEWGMEALAATRSAIAKALGETK